MSSRKSPVFPLLLMFAGLALLFTAVWWAWRDKRPAIEVDEQATSQPTREVMYRPADSDWWLVFNGDPALAHAVGENLSTLDPATPALPMPAPAAVAIAAAGPLRLWQFPAHTQLAIPLRNTDDLGRWHVESLADATLLFWLPSTVQTTAVDRVGLPPAGTGLVHKRWLQQRLSWPDSSCDALPALLQQLPEQAVLQFRQNDAAVSWQLYWQALPETLNHILQNSAAPQAQTQAADHWFWREADLAAIPRPSGCPVLANSGGFVTRLWQENDQLHAALARLGNTAISGFPLPLPDNTALKPVKLNHATAVANSTQAEQWLLQQNLLPEPGLLLAISHRRDDSFAGLELRLRTEAPNNLHLQWQWPLP